MEPTVEGPGECRARNPAVGSPVYRYRGVRGTEWDSLEGAMTIRTEVRRQRGRALGGPALILLGALASVGCTDSVSPERSDMGISTPRDCGIALDEIVIGAAKDGIPALTNPAMVAPTDPGADYLADTARVVGLEVEGRAYAIPLNILWWHEIVNLGFDSVRIAVTHCPLTGSTLAFDRHRIDGAELGVSGLLYRSNLIMYDRSSTESLWPQMERGARCGPLDGIDLAMFPVVEVRWDRWRALHPGTRVVSSATGYTRDYRRYPYGNYADLNNPQTSAGGPEIDERRPPKERVLGIPVEGGGGIAFPFGLLEEAGAPVAVVHHDLPGQGAVVFWSGDAEAAMAFEPRVGEQLLTFTVLDGAIMDRQTGTVWSVDGRALEGSLAGERLPMIETAYVAYWFAWAAFQPETAVWGVSP